MGCGVPKPPLLGEALDQVLLELLHLVLVHGQHRLLLVDLLRRLLQQLAGLLEAVLGPGNDASEALQPLSGRPRAHQGLLEALCLEAQRRQRLLRHLVLLERVDRGLEGRELGA
eukprot:6884853-Lingulodinium_polyedra.AAC.1